jgi:hypothetical protein
MPRSKKRAIVLTALVRQQIYFLRETHVMLDADLAKLYGVTTSNLNKAVQRNRNRFPEDFMFSLTKTEAESLRFQSGISNKKGRGGRRYAPLVFTEQGIAMLSSVLRSDRAVQVNIAIMRAFVQLRTLLATHDELRRKIEEMERKYDARFRAVFATIKQMLETPIPPKRAIGFHSVPDRQTQPRKSSITP